MYDVVVVGGGPIGGYVADKIAKAGFSVALLEEHETIGEPVQCAGLVTPRVFDIVKHASSSIINKVRGAHIYSPKGQKITIDGGEAKALVIDRQVFDNNIIRRAESSGAEIICGSKVSGIERCANGWKVGSEIEGKLLIGADGANSKIRQWLDLSAPEFTLTGIDAEVEGVGLEQDYLHVLVGENVAPNFFAWVIPAGARTRVGLCTRDAPKPLTHYYDRLFEAGLSAEMLQGSKLITRSAGQIPLGLLVQTHAEGAMLVGDAASQVKATTGGGIYTGLVCAGHCADTAIKALEKGVYSEKALAAYQKAWMNDIGGELKRCLMLHRILSSTKDRDFEVLFDVFADEKILALINELGDIDYPSKLAWALLKKEPRLIKYAGTYLRHLMT